jgi:ATP-binding protein involved in chromosome partitioning
MTNITQESITETLRGAQDPALERSFGELNMIKKVEVHEDGTVHLNLDLPMHGSAYQEAVVERVRVVAQAIPGVSAVRIEPTTRVRAVGGQPGKGGIAGVKNAIAVASGKGGVGKSTVAANLAVALARDGAKVGLLDADVYGPSMPLMMGVNAQPQMRENKIVPLEAFGVKVMSIGFLLPSDKALIWRGPLVAQLMNQFLNEVEWGELDYLIVDMPPGTGDVQLTLVQKIQVAGAVIVTTPQDIALADAIKGLKMFEEVKTPILGIIENMSYFVCPHCGERTDIFSSGGGQRTAQRYGVHLLGMVPLDITIREGGDIGHPVVIGAPDTPPAQAFRAAARQVAAGITLEATKRPHRPTIMLKPN